MDEIDESTAPTVKSDTNPGDQKPPQPDLGTHHAFSRVPIEITVSVGKARPLVRDLINVTKETILPLDKRIDDPVELFVGDKLIARGTLVEMDGDDQGRLAVCLTEVSELGKGI